MSRWVGCTSILAVASLLMLDDFSQHYRLSSAHSAIAPEWMLCNMLSVIGLPINFIQVHPLRQVAKLRITGKGHLYLGQAILRTPMVPLA